MLSGRTKACWLACSAPLIMPIPDRVVQFAGLLGLTFHSPVGTFQTSTEPNSSHFLSIETSDLPQAQQFGVPALSFSQSSSCRSKATRGPIQWVQLLAW